MGPSLGLPRLSRISVLLLLSSTAAHASAIPSLFQRQDGVCGGRSDLAQCGTGFPSEFCCPTNSECQRLNSGSETVTSVICCPKGSNCEFIQTVTCDISSFDAVAFPSNQIHLFNTTDVSLPKCGDKCCPVGYKCNGNSMCQAEPESAPSPTASATPTSSSPPYLISTPSPTNGAPTASQTTDAAPIQETKPQDDSFSGKAFAAGFIPGIVLGALFCFGLIWFLKKRKANASPQSRFSGDFGRVSRIISDPIYDPEHAARTDFIRQASQRQPERDNNVNNSPPYGQPFNTRPESTESGMVMQSSMRAAAGVSTGPGGFTPKLRSLWERTPKLGFGSPAGFASLPENPHEPQSQMQQVRPPPPLIRAGSNTGRDPYKTPSMHTQTPGRTMSYTRSHRSSNSSTAVPLKSNLTPQRRPSLQRTPAQHRPPPIQVPVQQQRTPERQHQQPRMVEHQGRPEAPIRENSQETIDVLMRPPSFLAPPRAPGLHEGAGGRPRRDTQDTTFTKLMERAGYEGTEREDVRTGGWAVNTPKR